MHFIRKGGVGVSHLLMCNQGQDNWYVITRAVYSITYYPACIGGMLFVISVHRDNMHQKGKLNVYMSHNATSIARLKT
jgi:hypothetical protein